MTVCCPGWTGIHIVHQAGSSLHNYIEMHGQQNIDLSANVKFLYVKSSMVLYTGYDIQNQTFAAKANDTQTSAKRLNTQAQKQ
jgi:hypothetical protein